LEHYLIKPFVTSVAFVATKESVFFWPRLDGTTMHFVQNISKACPDDR